MKKQQKKQTKKTNLNAPKQNRAKKSTGSSVKKTAVKRTSVKKVTATKPKTTVKKSAVTKKAAPKKTAQKKTSTSKSKSKTSGKTTKKSSKGGKSKPPKRKNVSQTIPNGTLIITNDLYFSGTDGKSAKTRMATTVDSNRSDELAVVKYTTSNKHGRSFKNDKGFKRHGDRVFTEDNEGKPIKIDNKKFTKGSEKRKISVAQANEIKRRCIKESRYKNTNSTNLREFKGRKKK